jgi:iron complex outermembrane recepter protein
MMNCCTAIRTLRPALTLAVSLVCLLEPGAAAAQTGTIAGRVVDADSDRPLSTALVQLVEQHREEPAGRAGEFSFTGLTPGSYSLLVELIGYSAYRREVEVRAGETTSILVRLSPAAIQLTGIVVTGAISERERRDVLSPISVVAGRELDRKLEGTVAATLQNEPGVSVASLGPAPARPVIRGLGGDRILILEDGQRPGDVSSLSADHAVAIDPLTARRIEVVRGPMSLLYGSSALGGVVNIVRDEIPSDRHEHVHGIATVQGSTVNSGLTGGGSMNVPAGPFVLRFEGSGRTAGDVSTPVGDLVNTSVRLYNAAAGAAWINGWGHAGASYRYYSNDYGIPGGFVGGHAQGVDIEMRRHSVRGEVEAHRDGSLISTLSVTGGFTDYSHAELDRSGNAATTYDQTLVSGEIISRLSPRGPLASGALGVRGQYRDIRTGGALRTPSTWDTNFALFGVTEFGTGELRLQAGARYDIADYNPRDTTATILAGGERVRVRPRTFGSFSGSIGLLWVASDAVRLGTSMSRAYRTPDFNELYSNGPHLAANSYDVGDTFLDEESGFGVDAFIRYATDRASFELAAFRNQLNDYIFPSSRGRAESGTTGGRPRFQYTNEDARFEGLEGELQLALLPNLVFDANASLVRARFTSDRAPIPIITPTDTSFVDASPYPPFIPPVHGYTGLRWEEPEWFAGGGIRWTARQDRTGDFEAVTPGYGIAQLDAGYRFVGGGRTHAITLRVGNLFDREYRDHLSRVKDIMPEPGRDVSLTYRLTF